MKIEKERKGEKRAKEEKNENERKNRKNGNGRKKKNELERLRMSGGVRQTPARRTSAVWDGSAPDPRMIYCNAEIDKKCIINQIKEKMK